MRSHSKVWRTRGSPLRLAFATHIRKHRAQERKAHRRRPGQPVKYITNSGLAENTEYFNFDIEGAARALRKLNNGSLNLLDVGAGEGIWGIQLKRKLGGMGIELHAISLARPFSRTRVVGSTLQKMTLNPHDEFTSYRVGTLQRKSHKMPRKKIDIAIVSFNLVNLRNVLRVLRTLRPRGLVLLDFDSQNPLELEMGLERLERMGFITTVLGHAFDSDSQTDTYRFCIQRKPK